MATLAYYRWDWAKAIGLYRQAAECWEQAGHQAGVALAAGNLAEILSDRGLGEEAALRIEQALRVCDAMGDRSGAANAKALLGRLAGHSGRIDEARVTLTEAAEELRSLGETNYLEYAETALAEVEAFRGDASLALEIVAGMLDADHRYTPGCTESEARRSLGSGAGRRPSTRSRPRSRWPGRRVRFMTSRQRSMSCT